MRQYAEGHKFVQTVVERVGIDDVQPDLDVARDAAAPRRDRRSGRVDHPRRRRLTRPWPRCPLPVAAVRTAVRRSLQRLTCHPAR